jgi:hypothetical protein
MNKHSKYRPLLDEIQSEIMLAEVGVTGVYQYMLEALDGAETVETALREELEALKQSIPKVRADAIREAAVMPRWGGQPDDIPADFNAYCEAIHEMHEHANKIEAG